MNFESFDKEIFTFQHPFTFLVVGPTKSGKTQYIYKMLQNIDRIMSTPPNNIYFFYSEWQPIYNLMLMNIPKLKMIKESINLADLKNEPHIPKLVIFDDLMSELAKDDSLNTIFTKGAHHWSTSVIFIVQNLFFNGIRNARLNSHYILLFKAPDKQQINCLARQLYPGKVGVLLEAYRDATSERYNPLLIDLTNEIDERFRLRTHVLPGETMIIYKPKHL